MTTVQAAADKNNLSASELARIWRIQEVTESTYGLDHIHAELLADAADKDLDRVGVAIEVLVVEMLYQFGPRHHAAGVVHEIGQQPVFVRGQLDRIAIDADPARARVQAYRTTIEFALGVPRRPAQQGPDAREYLFQVEWFCHIVIGAGIKSLDLVAPTVACREDQHRHRAPDPTPSFKDRNAVHFRQTYVEDHRIVGFTLPEIVSLFAVKGAVNH